MLNQNNAEVFVPDAVEQIRVRLESAAAGLCSTTRGEASFRFVYLPAPERHLLTPEAFGALLGVPPGTPVGEAALEGFLAGYVGEEGTQSRTTRERFAMLLDVFVQNLEEPRLFRTGSGEVQYFLVGWTPDGAIAGLRTSGMEP